MGGAGHTVLVVDDDDSLRMLCRVNLEFEGYRVLEAPTVEIAEELLRGYVYGRPGEGRAVRVGEKEVSERAEIVARYRDLFSREQVEALHAVEQEASDDDDRERLYRLRKTCEAGVVSAELAEREDA